MVTPALIVTISRALPFQPFASAYVRRLKLDWLVLTVNKNFAPPPKPKPLALDRARVVRIGITSLYVNCV